MKKLLILSLLFSPLLALAINVSIPQSPDFGYIPRGNANGTYTPVATSTLGIIDRGWDALFGNSTTTNATSTSLYISNLLGLNGTYISDFSEITGINFWSDSGTALYPATTTRKVGIGTSTPASTLTVVGDANITGTTTLGWGSKIGGPATGALSGNNYMGVEEFLYGGLYSVPLLTVHNEALPQLLPGTDYVGGIRQGIWIIESDAVGGYINGSGRDVNFAEPSMRFFAGVDGLGDVVSINYATTSDTLYFEEASGYQFDNSTAIEGGLFVATDLDPVTSDSDGSVLIGKQGGAWEALSFDNANSKFTFSDDLEISGYASSTSLYVSGNSTTTGNLTVNGNINTNSEYLLNGESFLYSNADNFYAGYLAGNRPTSYPSSTRNVAIGSYALDSAENILNTVAIGYQALRYSTTSQDNLAIGYYSLRENLTGNRNTAIGAESMQSNLSGQENTGIGFWAMKNNETGDNNTGLGDATLYNNVSGSNNTAVGDSALYRNNSGGNNTALGFQALLETLAGGNTAIGYNALNQNETGVSNTAIGNSAGKGVGTTNASIVDTNMVFLGTYATRDSAVVASTTVIDNGIAIGYNAKVGGSNMMALGGTGDDAIKVGIGTSTPPEELTVVGDLRVGSTTNYWATSELDLTGSALGDVGYYPMLTGYSDGTFGNIGTIADSLSLYDTADDDLTSLNFVGNQVSSIGNIEYDNQTYTFNFNELLGDANVTVEGNLAVGTTTSDTKLDVYYASSTDGVAFSIHNGTQQLFKVFNSVVGGLIAYFGSAINHTGFEADGTMVMEGNATVFKDQLGDALILAQQGPGIATDEVEATVDFSATANLNDYLYANYQLNHDRKIGSSIDPHIHFFQASSSMPNFLIDYRWQVNGTTSTTTWTRLKQNTPIFTYATGTLHQIANGSSITSPTSDNLSDILQLRVYRDTDNDSGLFDGADIYPGSAKIMSIDVHYEIDTLGSRTEYSK